MTGRERASILTLAALLVLLGAFVASQFRLTTDITSFLPSAEDRALASLSREIMDSSLSRTMVLALEGPDAEVAATASRRFEALLLDEPAVTNDLAFLEGGPAAEVERAAFELFSKRRLAYLAPNAEQARRRLSDAGLAEAAAALKASLSGPLSPMIGRIAHEDPFLVLPTLLERVQASRAGSLSIFDGRFLAGDQKTAILFLGTRSSALDEATQAPLLTAIDRAFERLQRETERPLVLEQSGVNRYAVRAASAIRGDIQRISIVSSILLVVGLLFLFRSLRLVALASIPIGSGLLAGSAASLFFFDRVHGISLAFGAALISVSVDYVVHLYCHDALVRPSGGARESLRILRRPLATGCLTTLTGFAALAVSPLDGLREIGTFAIAGIATAFITTVVFIPPAIRRPERLGFDRDRWHARVDGLVAALRAKRNVLAILPLALLAFVAFGISTARWESDFARMSQLDADIRAEDDRVRAKVARFEQMRFVVALGTDDETALQVNDRVAPRLEAAIEAGELDTFSSAATLLPSARTQREVAAIAATDKSLGNRFDEAFGAAGFRLEPFANFRATLGAPAPPPLDAETLLGSPLAGIVRPFRTILGDRVAFVSFLGTVQDPDALRARIEDIDDAHLLEQSELLQSGQSAYQDSALNALMIGLVLVVSLLWLRYRQLKPALCAFVPPLLAVATTVSVLAVAGYGVDFITLTSLLFITCLGVDYSVLLVDASIEDEPRALVAAMSGATIASGTTAFAFGLLSLSPHPILGSLGLTTFVGVTASFLLAPLVLVVVGVDASPTVEGAP